MKHDQHPDKSWRADAKDIVSLLRKTQDAILQEFGYEGFSFVCIRMQRVVDATVETLQIEPIDGCAVVSRMVNDKVIDTVNLHIPTPYDEADK